MHFCFVTDDAAALAVRFLAASTVHQAISGFAGIATWSASAEHNTAGHVGADLMRSWVDLSVGDGAGTGRSVALQDGFNKAMLQAASSRYRFGIAWTDPFGSWLQSICDSCVAMLRNCGFEQTLLDFKQDAFARLIQAAQHSLTTLHPKIRHPHHSLFVTAMYLLWISYMFNKDLLWI